MGIFCSFLVFAPSETELVSSLCCSAGWNIHFITDPSRRFRFNENGGWGEISNPSARKHIESLGSDEQLGKLLVIDAEEAEANNIVQLILAAGIVLEGYTNRSNRRCSCFELPADEDELSSLSKNIFQTTWFFEQFSYFKERSVAVALASKSWTDRRVVYAIHKLALSYTTEYITPWSAHPGYGQVFQKHSEEFSNHVVTSMAINAAFSAIEELDVKVKSRQGMPRWLDKEFTWSPSVLSDIRKRLTASGIDPDQTIHWVVRGSQTEVAIEPRRAISSNHQVNPETRDMVFSLPDAISACGFLRDKKTAHAFASDTNLIGPYELFNVQQVARLIILCKCGLWETWTEDLKMNHFLASTESTS